MVKEIETESGVFGISPVSGGGDGETPQNIKIEYYRGKDIAVSVPESIDGSRVTEIGKKAFLGAKTITRIELPDSIESVGDWAFASCSGLREIIFPKKMPTIGSGLFKDDHALEKIIPGDKEVSGDIPYLLALSVSKMDAPYLFDTEKAGCEDWTNHFDSVIMQILGREDTEGFSKMLLCGEEDYVGDDSNLDTYVLLSIKEKIRILLVRLIHGRGLSEENRKVCTEYLKENMSKALWPLILEEHGEDKEYFELLIDIGCINKSNVSGLIESMGDHYTQMKGFLIRYKGQQGGDDFFGDLDL